jgi:hypothetical protein
MARTQLLLELKTGPGFVLLAEFRLSFTPITLVKVFIRFALDPFFLLSHSRAYTIKLLMTLINSE